MIEKLETPIIEDDGELTFLNPQEVADIMKISVVSARELFKRDDFPSVRVGTNFKVLKSAFVKWANEKHE